jgi:hypothetical protein
VASDQPSKTHKATIKQPKHSCWEIEFASFDRSNEAIASLTGSIPLHWTLHHDDDGHSGANQRQPRPHLNNCYCHHCDRTATNAMQFFRRHRDLPTVQIEVENIAQSKTISLIINLQINTTTKNKGSKQQSTNDASWML